MQFDNEARYAGTPDEEIIQRVKDGDTVLYELLMRRHNNRLFRAARAIVRDAGEAEDIVQEAFVRAWEHLHQFRGESEFGTWLTRIAVHEALARVKRRRLWYSLQNLTEVAGREIATFVNWRRSPEDQVLGNERDAALAKAIENLPLAYRAVFMLREVEMLTVQETAKALGLSATNVRVRDSRARALLRRAVGAYVGVGKAGPFPLELSRCDRLAAEVLYRIKREQELRSAMQLPS